MPRQTHYRPRKRYKRTCPVCGDPFTATRSDAVYDKPACRKAISRALALVASVLKHPGLTVQAGNHTTAKRANQT